MPVIECDPEEARSRLEDAGIPIESGHTTYERWRTEHEGAIAVAYDDKVVIQGQNTTPLVGLLEDHGGRGHLYFDGASRGNPGPAAIGWVIVSGDGIVSEGSRRIGTKTNNQAEYEALIAGLEAAVDLGFEEVTIRGDSELIVKQVSGAWNTNDPELQMKRVRVHELLAQISEWTIEHVPREINRRADKLATDALDE